MPEADPAGDSFRKAAVQALDRALDGDTSEAFMAMHHHVHSWWSSTTALGVARSVVQKLAARVHFVCPTGGEPFLAVVREAFRRFATDNPKHFDIELLTGERAHVP